MAMRRKRIAWMITGLLVAMLSGPRSVVAVPAPQPGSSPGIGGPAAVPAASAAPDSREKSQSPTPDATPGKKPERPEPTEPSKDRDQDSELKVNPYGPTVTNPATLTNAGVPEYEIFYFHSNNSFQYKRFISTPVLVKYTWSRQWQVSLGTSGYSQIKLPPDGPTNTAMGDPSVTFKYLFLPPREHHSTQSVQLSWQPSVSPVALGISTGRPETTVTWLYSRDLAEPVSVDANLWLTHLTAPDRSWHLTFNQSADINYTFARNLQYTFEMHHFGSAGSQLPDTWSMQHILSWSAAPQCNLSAGVEFGLNQAAPSRTYMVGLVFLVDGRRGQHTRRGGAFPNRP